MSFIVYPFFQPSLARLRCGNIRILLPKDIVAMKIVAISQRGRKRDFVDLYWHCLNRESLGDVVRRALRQYTPGSTIIYLIFLKV
jgi:predicted nucleotidyltransferase component of viral defense system